jgi:hypothetical protein
MMGWISRLDWQQAGMLALALVACVSFIIALTAGRGK